MSPIVRTGRISRRVAAIAASATLAVDAKAKALQGRRRADVIGFGAGEPDFPTPGAHRRGRRGRLPRPGEPPLHARPAACPSCKEAIAAKTAARLGLRGRAPARCSSPTAASTPSTTPSRRCSTRATRCSLPGPVLDHLPRGDRPRRRRAGRGPHRRGDRLPGHRRPARGGPHRAHQGAACSCRRRTRPARSTRRDEVEAIGRWAARARRVGASPTRSTSTSSTATTRSRRCRSLVPELADRCVVLNGVAKTYAMTGWRVGWMIGPPDVIEAATNLQSPRHLQRRQRRRSAPRSPP